MLAGSLIAKGPGLLALCLVLGLSAAAVLSIAAPSAGVSASSQSTLPHLPGFGHAPGIPGLTPLSVRYPNGSPFVREAGTGGSETVDDSILPEEYANPNGSNWVDSYLLQSSPTVSGQRASLQVWEGSNYSTAIDSISLGLLAPGAPAYYTYEGGAGVLSVGSTAAVVAAHDENGNNVTSLLSDPAANSSTAAGGYFEGSSGDVVLAGFGVVNQADQDVLLLRAGQDPQFPPSAPSGISVQVQDPATGTFATVGFVAPREYWSTVALPLTTGLPSGSQSVVVRLLWQGTHGLAWLALGEGVSNATAAPAKLLSATSSQGWNWTSLLAVTDGVDADFLPGTYATLVFALPYAPPAGTSFVLFTNGAPWTTPPAGAPHSAFSVDPAVLVAHRALLFRSLSWDNASTLVNYNWSFGDGSFGSGATTNHTYPIAGWYNVTLNVTDAAGASNTSEQRILVYPFWDWQANEPTWGSGNLCTVQSSGNVLTCSSHASNQCRPPLAYNFSVSNSTLAISLSGSRSCLAANVLGQNDVVYLNVTGGDWTYLDLAVVGPHDQLRVDLSGSGTTASFALYVGNDSYALKATGSRNTLSTYLVSTDLKADASPKGQNSKNDTVALSATGSNDHQNVTWVAFPAPRSAVHNTTLPGTGQQNIVAWANTSLFASSWAYAINLSGCAGPEGQGCCQGFPGGGHNDSCCGWQGGGWGPDRQCCGWWGQGSAGADRCCWWWGPLTAGHCCWWGESPATSAGPDHGCRGEGPSFAPTPPSISPEHPVGLTGNGATPVRPSLQDPSLAAARPTDPLPNVLWGGSRYEPAPRVLGRGAPGA